MGSNKSHWNPAFCQGNRVGNQKRPPMNKKLLKTGSLRSRDEACKITKMMKYWIFCPQFRALSVKLGISVSRYLVSQSSLVSQFLSERERQKVYRVDRHPRPKKSNLADFSGFFPAPVTPSDFSAFGRQCKNNVVSVEIELSLIS